MSSQPPQGSPERKSSFELAWGLLVTQASLATPQPLHWNEPSTLLASLNQLPLVNAPSDEPLAGLAAAVAARFAARLALALLAALALAPARAAAGAGSREGLDEWVGITAMRSGRAYP
mmetsp:Transcript_93300/g.301825  ORF Transcript_93300/g.301825 Transcript_93300/m.301825 type:complete len:118 (-) Transcript_93300:283-636(-)